MKNSPLALFKASPRAGAFGGGRGVCGTAASERRAVRVADVHAFPGHIACDLASRSELVAPLVGRDGRVLGVLDLDSPDVNRFDEIDERGVVAIAARLAADLAWPPRFDL